MRVRADMVNGYACHGGIVFAFADSAFAFACNSTASRWYAAGAGIDFLAPTPRGERVTATATEVSRSARHGIYDVARGPMPPARFSRNSRTLLALARTGPT